MEYIIDIRNRCKKCIQYKTCKFVESDDVFLMDSCASRYKPEDQNPFS